MAGIKIESELRPCIVKLTIRKRKTKNGEVVEEGEYKYHKALFHRWNVFQDVIPPSPMMGGHTGGQIQHTTAIIEYEDGTVHECYPQEIQFLDGKINEYCFENKEDET